MVIFDILYFFSIFMTFQMVGQYFFPKFFGGRQRDMRSLLGHALVTTGIFMLIKLFFLGSPAQPLVTAQNASISIAKPLQIEVNFADKEKVSEDANQVVETQYGSLTFSNNGASLVDYTFVRGSGNKKQSFPFISKLDQLEKEQAPFLVALDTVTPYHYVLKEKKEVDTATYLTYQVSSGDADISKKFTVYKGKPQIDLELTIDPKHEVSARVIWPSPRLADDQDVVASSLVLNDKNTFIQQSEEKIDLQTAYLAPKIFGSQDKYFMVGLVNDKQNFAYRAYYKLVDRSLLSFLEAEPISKKTTWTLSFYAGPKESRAIALVDKRLEKTLNYGFFSFLTKPLLAVLEFINRYVHNYGLAIIIVTLLLKLLLLPFSIRGTRKMAEMQKYGQKMEYLKRKYHGDPEGLKQAQLKLLQEQGIGPMLGGCLPMLVQFPFFIALSSGLTNSLELYRASFLWIPDLSMADPYYILPLLATGGMLLGGILQTPGGARQRMGGIVMGVVFGAFSSTFSAGSNLFIATNICLHGVQTQLQSWFKLN